jgi:hypothetical protein
MRSLLASLVFYGFLLLSSLNLLLSSLFPDSRHTKVGYFNTVLGFTLFCASCIADTFDTPTFGGEAFKPPKDTVTGCCANCDIARANQVLFFADSPLYLIQAGIVGGYLLVHLLMAGAQMLDSENRTVWGGVAWGTTLGLLLTVRFIIMFDGSTLALVPDSVFYVLLFSQPLVTLSVIYWLFLYAFLFLSAFEGLPRLNILGLRIVRSLGLGLTLVFVIVSCVVHGMRGMLTVPLFLVLCAVLASSVVGVLEGFLGHLPKPAPTSVRVAAPSPKETPPVATARPPVPDSLRGRTFIHPPVHLGGDKKAV